MVVHDYFRSARALLATCGVCKLGPRLYGIQLVPLHGRCPPTCRLCELKPGTRLLSSRLILVCIGATRPPVGCVCWGLGSFAAHGLACFRAWVRAISETQTRSS